jgi:hypothetical protein
LWRFDSSSRACTWAQWMSAVLLCFWRLVDPILTKGERNSIWKERRAQGNEISLSLLYSRTG